MAKVQTQGFGSGRKESPPFVGVAANILPLACATDDMHGCSVAFSFEPMSRAYCGHNVANKFGLGGQCTGHWAIQLTVCHASGSKLSWINSSGASCWTRGITSFCFLQILQDRQPLSISRSVAWWIKHSSLIRILSSREGEREHNRLRRGMIKKRGII
jgi:hypothetical protein